MKISVDTEVLNEIMNDARNAAMSCEHSFTKIKKVAGMTLWTCFEKNQSNENLMQLYNKQKSLSEACNQLAVMTSIAASEFNSYVKRISGKYSFLDTAIAANIAMDYKLKAPIQATVEPGKKTEDIIKGIGVGTHAGITATAVSIASVRIPVDTIKAAKSNIVGIKQEGADIIDESIEINTEITTPVNHNTWKEGDYVANVGPSNRENLSEIYAQAVSFPSSMYQKQTWGNTWCMDVRPGDNPGLFECSGYAIARFAEGNNLNIRLGGNPCNGNKVCDTVIGSGLLAPGTYNVYNSFSEEIMKNLKTPALTECYGDASFGNFGHALVIEQVSVENGQTYIYYSEANFDPNGRDDGKIKKIPYGQFMSGYTNPIAIISMG